MRTHKTRSEPARTAPLPTDLEAFRAHYRETLDFTDALREGRCRRTNHFDAHLGATVSVFKPLFSPWNMEILFLVYMRGPQRFNALKRALDGVSSRVLTDKLRHLESAGLLARAETPTMATYGLTPRGAVLARHLHPIVFYLHNEPALDLAATSTP